MSHTLETIRYQMKIVAGFGCFSVHVHFCAHRWCLYKWSKHVQPVASSRCLVASCTSIWRCQLLLSACLELCYGIDIVATAHATLRSSQVTLLLAVIGKTLGAIGSGFGSFGFGNGGSSGDNASRGMKAAKPTEQESSSNSWAAF